jgi:outer membrane lipoprotein SlyB
LAVATFTCGSGLIAAAAIGAGTGSVVGGITGAVGGKELGKLVDRDCKK